MTILILRNIKLYTMFDIKTVLQRYGITYAELGRRMDIARSNVHKMANSDNITVKQLERVAEAIGCSIHDFFPGENTREAICSRCGSKFTATTALSDFPDADGTACPVCGHRHYARFIR